MIAKACLIAGCVFAPGVLKAFLDPIKKVMTAGCRDYVDNIAIIATRHKAGRVIPKF